MHHEREKLAQRQEEKRIQMDLMRTLLEGATPVTPRQRQPDIFFRKLTEADEIEAYLATFEWLRPLASIGMLFNQVYSN